MAIKKAESKQGLIIALVISVLITIGAGVAAYFGFADQERLKAQTKDAQTKEKNAKTDLEWEKFKALTFKAYAGHATPKDLENLGAQRLAYQDGKGTLGAGQNDKSEIDNLVKQMDDKKVLGLGWDEVKKAPASTYREQVADLKKALETAQGTLAKTDEGAKAAAEKYNAEANAHKEYQRKLDETVKGISDQAKAAMDKKHDSLKNEEAKVEKYVDEIDKTKKGYEADKAEKEKQINALNAQVKLEQGKLQAALQKIQPMDLLTAEEAKGKVVRLDSSGLHAFINLGSHDNVKPQLTFSVFAPGPGGKAKGSERKAALEVVSVLEPHLSRARLFEVRDAGRDPILPGDLLFNPSWSPNMRQHVAIAGLIDLGDGRDGTQEFVRNLEKQGIVVDAYLDMKDLTVKGRGMVLSTNYLVLGEVPTFEGNVTPNVNDPLFQRKSDVLNQVSKMREEASKLGITQVPALRFMSMIGYRLPQMLPGSRPPTFFGLPSSGGAAAEGKEPAKDAAPAKDDKDAPKKGDKDAPKKGDKDAAKDKDDK